MNVSKEGDKNRSLENGKKNRWIWGTWRQWGIALGTSALIIGADQLFKYIVAKNVPQGLVVFLINPVLWITNTHNTEGLFGLTYGPYILYIILPLIAIAFVIYLLLQRQSRFVTVLLGLIIGGGLGNLIDRLFRYDVLAQRHYVLDWINMGIKGKWQWATYNIADASIVIAVILLLIYEFFFSKPREKKGKEEKKPQ